eukprot:EG_transcript_18817
MSLPKSNAPAEQMMGSDHIPYGIPISVNPGLPAEGHAAAGARPTAALGGAGQAASPALGVPLGMAPTHSHVAVHHLLAAEGIKLGTEQEHDAAMVAACCCEKWGVLGTMLCCPSVAGIAGMCKGCGINLMTWGIFYLILLTVSLLFMRHNEDYTDEVYRHHFHDLRPEAAPMQHPVLGYLGCCMLFLVGLACFQHGRKRYAQWHSIRAMSADIPVATVAV